MNWDEIWKEIKDISREDPPTYIIGGEKEVACMKPYQVDSLQAITYVFHEKQNGAILADEVGLGKTWVALELASRVINHGGVVVVVAKRDLLINNWKKDWAKIWSQTKVGKSSRSGVANIKLVEKECTRQQRNTRLYLVPMTFARRDDDVWETIIRKIRPDFIIIDEVQNFKSELRQKLISTLRRKKDSKVLALTATPLDIEIGREHWETLFDLLNLNETKYELLNHILEISKEIKADSSDDEQKNIQLIDEYRNCINKYRRLFKGIIFRNQKKDNYSFILKELEEKTNLNKNKIADYVKDRIKKKELLIKIEEGTDNELYWHSMICALEAMSFCKGEADVRARLTVGSAHSLFEILHNLLEKGNNNSNENSLSREGQIWRGIVWECLKQLTGMESIEKLPKDQKKLEKEEEKGKKKIIEANPMYAEVIKTVENHYRSEETKNEGILIFSYNTKPAKVFCNILKERLEKIDKERGRKECLEYCDFIDGSKRKDKRKAIIEKFNCDLGDKEKPRLKCLIAQIKVGGEGLNLHRNCDTVIFLHPEWNPRSIDQGVGRVDRLDSLWFKKMEKFLKEHKKNSTGKSQNQPPRITVYIPKFSGTYDISKWEVLEKRWQLMDKILNGNEDQAKDPLNPFQYLQGVRRRQRNA